MQNRKTWLLGLVAAGALCAGSVEAEAKPKDRGRKTRTVELARSQDGADGNARGSVEVTEGDRGDKMVVRVNRLERRSDYHVVDASSGEVLGTIRTDRKGKGSIRLGAGNRNSRRGGLRDFAEGEESGQENGEKPEFECPEAVLVIDCLSDEPVLECELPVIDPVEYEQCYASGEWGAVETGMAMGFLSHFAAEGKSYDSFSMTFCPGYDPSEGGIDDPFTVTFTSGGEEDIPFVDPTTMTGLPFGVESIQDLLGMDFQVCSADGSEVLLEGALPEECIEPDVFPKPIDDGIFGIAEGEWDGEENWEIDWDLFGDAPIPVDFGDLGDFGEDGGIADFTPIFVPICPEDEGERVVRTLTLKLRDPETDEFVEVGQLTSIFDVWGNFD